eukprot:946974-Heterocapsa_arctica.AAC.1
MSMDYTLGSSIDIAKELGDLEKFSKGKTPQEKATFYGEPTTNMKVIVEWNRIGEVCQQAKSFQVLMENKDKLCGGGP